MQLKGLSALRRISGVTRRAQVFLPFANPVGAGLFAESPQETDPRRPRPVALAQPQPIQLLIGHAEVVGQLMEDRPPYLLDKLSIIRELYL